MGKSNQSRKARVAVLAVGLTLTGCMGAGPDAGPGSFSVATLWNGNQAADPALTPAEQRLREDANTFKKTVFGGIAYNALVGAAIGAAVGFLRSNGDLKQTATYAALGSGAGGVYGAVDGYRTAVKQEANRAQVREIKLMVDKVEEENARIEQSIQTSDLVIAETKGKIELAQQRLQKQEITVAEYEGDLRRAQSNVAELDKLIAGIQTRRDEFSSVAESMREEGEDTTALDAQIAEGTQRLAQLQTERDLLAKDLEVARIG